MLIISLLILGLNLSPLVSAGGAGALQASSYQESSGKTMDTTFLPPPTKTPTPVPTANTSTNATTNSTGRENISANTSVEAVVTSSGEALSLADQIKADASGRSDRIRNQGTNQSASSDNSTLLLSNPTGWTQSFGSANPLAPTSCT